MMRQEANGLTAKPAALTSGAKIRVVNFHQIGSMRHFSAAFLSRLESFTVLPENWDGEGGLPIESKVTKAVRRLAFDSLVSAPEPFTAPTSDGAVLLKWDLPNGIEVECFIDPEGLDPDIAVTQNGRVREVHVQGQEGVVELLETLSVR